MTVILCFPFAAAVLQLLTADGIEMLCLLICVC